MATASNIIALGTAPALSEALAYSDLTPITATGTTSATAKVIKSQVTQLEVTASASNTGIRLPTDADFQQNYFVLNSSAVTARVYPPTGGSIDGNATDAAITIDTNVNTTFARIDRTRWVTTGSSTNANPVIGTTLIVTSGSSVNVPNTVTTVLLNKAIAGAITLNLGPVATRTTPVAISDIAGSAGDITVLPNGAETIQGLASATLTSFAQGLGSSGAMTFYPNTTISGWYVTT